MYNVWSAFLFMHVLFRGSSFGIALCVLKFVAIELIMTGLYYSLLN